jgi:hypothetical protein
MAFVLWTHRYGKIVCLLELPQQRVDHVMIITFTVHYPASFGNSFLPSSDDFPRTHQPAQNTNFSRFKILYRSKPTNDHLVQLGQISLE